jgi:hypothetical protein
VDYLNDFGGSMRVWLPDYVYRTFPLLAGMAGLLGCLAGTAATLSLGSVLILYCSGVYCMRRF